jgi:hypothetical protein
LVLGRQVSVERQELHPAALGSIAQQAEGTADFISPGHEDKDVTCRLLAEETSDLLSGGLPRSPPWEARRGDVLDLDRIGTSISRKGNSIAEPRSEGLGVEGRGHRDDQKVGAGGRLEPTGEGEGNIRVEVALMELIEDDSTDALEGGVG